MVKPKAQKNQRQDQTGLDGGFPLLPKKGEATESLKAEGR